MRYLDNQTKRFPRTMNEAFPNTPEYAESIELCKTHAGSGLFEFILLLIALAILAFSIGWWL
jgi:hypothetical protein